MPFAGLIKLVMRNMSFMLTTEQILNKTKTVTRRLGWEKIESGDKLQPIKKGQGLKKGETITKLGNPIVVVSARREPLNRMTTDLNYGFSECEKEGFKEHPAYRFPSEFVAMFCNTHRHCIPDTTITRIEFKYT
jgi:hypothetical protein